MEREFNGLDSNRTSVRHIVTTRGQTTEIDRREMRIPTVAKIEEPVFAL